ncbi:GGDEF domain-containing protein [Gilvimarinus algae]|uniref:diguanylate cyclase n=1 Tax=Gilvimarinus algae TaxID=3058037 RepID=A0ABT8TI04_9GAMM|nr:GGDEF domain-containing protein [Gilvimarinus sp. SDUM040014]MDO3383556.1 GGDEF domain-containing protein [Gilvimarinus sp. SDUM040014]
MAAKLRLEKTLFVLVVLTAVAIFGRDWLLRETFVIDPAADFNSRLYGDKNAGGTTDTELLSRSPEGFEWRCDLRSGSAYPYCGFEIFIGESRTRGIDMSDYQKVRLWLDYEGVNTSIRVFLRNFDRRYSSAADDTSTKYNQVEFAADSPQDFYEFGFDDFFVANWWLREHNIPPHLSHPQFNNLVSLEIQTGSGHMLGEHRFALRRVELVGQRYDTADWYLGIILAWAGVILGFLAYRVAVLTGEVRDRKIREQELIEVNALLDTRSRQLETLAKTDSLTGAFNRQGIEEAIKHGLWEWRHDHKPLSIVMMDVDHFKQINDTYGHSVGDIVLAGISSLVKEHIRTTDLFARWGGEEFVLVCRNTRINYAAHIAEKLRRLIAEHDFEEVGQVTASFGVAALSGKSSIEDLFQGADEALYRAKDKGRNRTEVAGGL